MPNSNVPITAGTGTNIDTFTIPGGDHRQVVIVGDRGGYKGRVSTWRTQGRVAAQVIFAIHNATGSTVVCEVKKITVDLVTTVAGALATPPPMIRLWKITALPTGGTALTKVAEDSANTSSASVTVLGDTSADNTLSATALATTRPAGTIVTEEYASRLVTAAGFEPMDRAEFLSGTDEMITLRALEGLCVFVDIGGSPVATNPATNHWIVTARWEEYTP